MKTKETISMRATTHPDHHLWCNRGKWWCTITIHGENNTTRRYRFSLRTHDLITARKKRDALFTRLAPHLQRQN